MNNDSSIETIENREKLRFLTSEERLLTPQEVADKLGVSQRWVRDHATRRQPRISAVKLGSLLRFRWVDVEEFLSRQMLQDSSQKKGTIPRR